MSQSLVFYPVRVGSTTFPLNLSTPKPELVFPLPEENSASNKVNGKSTTFALLDGPPYANGPLHLGHVFNKHLKDLSLRAAYASNHKTQWNPRWDCHGLPVELCVEKLGFDRKEPLSFVTAARSYAKEQLLNQKTTFETLGLSANWSEPVATMDPSQQSLTLKVLANMVKKNLLEVRYQPTSWCPACQSTVAGAEQETKSVTRTECVAPFFLNNETQDVFLSWTTTPWTLPYNEGLVVHPDALYQKFLWQGKFAWTSVDSWPLVSSWYPDAEVVGLPVKGESFNGLDYRTPWNSSNKVVTDDRVVSGAGTGCMHAVPAFDAYDYDVGKSHGWKVATVMDERGRFSEQAWTRHQGLKAGEEGSLESLKFLDEYENSAFWLKVFSPKVDVACCWRHKAPLVTRPSRQVFLVLSDEVRTRADALLNSIEFEPPVAKERLRLLMKSRPDWCLSRQRTWGVPMALVLDKVTGQPHACAYGVMERVAEAMATEGVECWWKSPMERWTEGLVKDLATVDVVPDVLDVWFDSGAVGNHQGGSDLVVEGHDQLRGWFQACLWVASALDNPAPFHRVVTHGFVVDGQGKKLSKSSGGDGATKKGDAPLWTTYPSDVVRLWSAMGEVGGDRPWSKDAVTSAQHAYNKFRGSLRFALSNVPANLWGQPLVYWDQNWTALDRFEAVNARKMLPNVLLNLKEGRYEVAVREALLWCDQVLSKGLYMRLKDRLYCAKDNTVAYDSAVETLREGGEMLVRLLSVLTPQLMAEALQVVPELANVSKEPLSSLECLDDDAEWSKKVLSASDSLNKAWETQGWKGGLQRGLLVLPVSLSYSQWQVEEALGVGQWKTQSSPPDDAVEVRTSLGDGWLSLATDSLCPRCRKPGALVETGVCQPCENVAQNKDKWRL